MDINKKLEFNKKDSEVDNVDLDTILVKEIGQFGYYQLRMVALSAMVVLFIGWSASEYIFTTARISTRCFIPECEIRYLVEFSPKWINNAIPISGSSLDNCRRYANTSFVEYPNDKCPKKLFDRSNIVFCEEFVYENTHSVVYNFGLACDEWKRTFIGSARNFGNFIALSMTGYVSDRWGRRFLLSITAVNTAIIGITRYWADSYFTFLVSQLAGSVFASGGFSCAYILMMEMIGPKYRVATGVVMSTFYTIGQITLGFIAWNIPNWRNLTLVLYIPQLSTICLFWILPESIRWCLSKKKYSEAGEILKQAAKVNGKQISEKYLEALRMTVEQEHKTSDVNTKEPWLVIQAFRNKLILLRILISPIWWITMTLVSSGLSINSVNISGNMYLNYVAVAAVEIPGYWMAVFLMDRIGRKPLLIAGYWLCAVCQIAYMFMPEELPIVPLMVYLTGKCCIAMVTTSLYVYMIELYPTRYRHSLFAFSSMIGRMGSIMAPLTPAMGTAIWTKFPFALFATFALVSGFLVLLTPETFGTQLPDTMEEATHIGKATK